MKHIDLSVITEKDLTGSWKVHERFINKSPNEALLAHQNVIDLLPTGKFKSINGKEVIGSWSMIKRDEFIYNPQLKFHQHGNEIGNAIVTRLYTTNENSEAVNKLTLYFSTGLEVVLKKTGP